MRAETISLATNYNPIAQTCPQTLAQAFACAHNSKQTFLTKSCSPKKATTFCLFLK